MKEIVVSAPGKIHLLGEHAVVYGKPALLAVINKRCTVTLVSRKDKQIEIISKNFSAQIRLSIDDALKKKDEAQRNLEKFLNNGDVSLLKLITKDPLDYATIAVGESLVLRSTGVQKGFTLTIDSEIPIGAGLGSSAAVAVSIAAAVTLYLEKKLDKQTIFDIAFRIEQKKHGRPSGGDPATVLHGGLVWFRKESDDLKIIQPIPFTVPKNIARNFYLIDTGKPEESTGEMIASVRKKFNADPSKIQKIFDDQERLTRDLLTAIKNSDITLMIRIIRAGERNLEKLGTVSLFVKKLIGEIEKSGGAAKISGGGGKTKGTGMLLVFHENKSGIEKVTKNYKVPLTQVTLGVDGLKYEK